MGGWRGGRVIRRFRHSPYPFTLEPGLLASLRAGSARHPHVLKVRCGDCALSARNLTAPPTALIPGALVTPSCDFSGAG
ncbi:hypothetical protein EKL29_19370 [Pantoea sp. YU22]|nr:hypothetical protein D7S44_20055 [Pantoea piersonii]RTY54816.1 hypothetical protein EKL29_19370 [Pantoea sp. YU22]